MSAIIRKIVTVVEETHLEMGQKVAPPTRRAAAIAVIENPFAGRYVEDLSPLIEIGEELGDLLSKRAVAALGIDGAKAHSYGKAAAVGENGVAGRCRGHSHRQRRRSARPSRRHPLPGERVAARQ